MTKSLFTTDWKFHEFALGTPVDSMMSSGLLKPVNIPHDWMIGHVSDLYKDSLGFYKKEFYLNPECDHTYLVRFEGVYMDSKIYCNGKEIFEWKYGYSTFEVDLTPYVLSGINTICVACTYQSPNSRWYSGAGIYRKVWFIDKDFAFFPSDGAYISTSKQDSSFNIFIDMEVGSKKITESVISHKIVDREGLLVASSVSSVSLNNGVCIDSQTLKIDNPHLWDINDPYLYTVTSSLLVNDVVLDSVTNPLGLRTFSFDSNKGFFLNDRNIKINGVCQHHDLGALGAAMNKTALRRQFEMLIEMGVNSIRTSHNMPAIEVMELADEMGILIYSESFDMWELPKTTYDYANYFPTWYEKDVQSWVRRDRNHPSLIIWGIGNEIYDTHAGDGLKWTRLLRDSVRKFDYRHNAYISIGSNYIEWDNAQKCSDELELSGYNYGERLYDNHHVKYPNWCIFGSETASTVQSRGIYHFPYEIRILTYEDGQCSSLGNCTTNWGAKNVPSVIADHRDRDFVFGQYLWTGWDYIGEPTPYHSKNSFFGQIDTAGFKKDTYYQYKAEWTDVNKSPMVHLLPYWDFNENQIIDVCAYSNAPFVELFFNGESLGKQFIDHKNGRELQGHWKLPYHKGELIVKAYDDMGNVVAMDSQKSFFDPANIVLNPSKNELIANGEDLSFIEISTIDKNGTLVANARNRVHIKVTGAGYLLGLDNGDSTDYEEYRSSSKRLFSGKLLAIVSATNEPGDIVVNVTSPGLPSETICLKSKPCETNFVPFIKEFDPYPSLLCDIPIRKIELHYDKELTLTPEYKTAEINFSILPSNATYKDVYFKVLTPDAVEANYATVSVDGSTATVTALGDGEFTLTAFANNDKDHPEVLSTLNFKAIGLGEATHDGYNLVPGIMCKKTHSEECKLSFLGGIFLPATSDSLAYITFENIDLKDYGSDEIHLPIFSFENEIPLEIYLGEYNSKSKCLYKGTYKAKSIYNTYQENVFKLSEKLKDTFTITFVFHCSSRFSVRGFYFTKKNKAYSRLSALDNSRITGDTFNIEKDAITSIGNNVCIEYSNMDFTDGFSHIKICGKSNNATTSIHIMFTEEDNNSFQLIEIPGSNDYKEYSFPLKSKRYSGTVSFLFLPGSDFDLKYFEFIK